MKKKYDFEIKPNTIGVWYNNWVKNKKKDKQEVTKYEFDKIVGLGFKVVKGKKIRKNPKMEVKWKNYEKTDLIRVNEFGSLEPVVEFLLDKFYEQEQKEAGYFDTIINLFKSYYYL